MADKELFGNSEQLEKDHFADPGNMVGDLISRREAEDIVRFECGEWTGLAETIVKRFEALPSAQPEQQWIPCSEQLPKDYESVNVTVRIPEGRYVKESAFLNGVWIGVSAPAEVVAWCPLPEPWKGDTP